MSGPFPSAPKSRAQSGDYRRSVSARRPASALAPGGGTRRLPSLYPGGRVCVLIHAQIGRGPRALSQRDGTGLAQLWLSNTLGSRTARGFLRVSAVAVIAGMVLAAELGDAFGKDWLLIPRMASTHGLLNGLGFVLLGLLGWLVESHEC